MRSNCTATPQFVGSIILRAVAVAEIERDGFVFGVLSLYFRALSPSNHLLVSAVPSQDQSPLLGAQITKDTHQQMDRTHQKKMSLADKRWNGQPDGKRAWDKTIGGANFFFSFFRTAPAEMPWQLIIWPSHHPSFSGSQRGHFEYSSQPITMICHTKRTATLAAHVLKALLFSRVYNWEHISGAFSGHFNKVCVDRIRVKTSEC